MLTLMLALAAVQAAPAPQAAEPPVATLAKAFSACIRARLPDVPATLSVEAGADQVLEQCKAERTALSNEIDAMTAAAPPEAKAGARAEFDQAMTMARGAIVAGLTERRQAQPR